MYPRFSIVIPTCDRAHLLQHTLRALLSIERDDVEFIVSDNFSSDNTDATIQSFMGDKRLKALRTNHRLAMPMHWDFALSHARGTFVIINGDDDLFVPDLLGRIDRIIEKLNPKVVTWRIGLYHHPDYQAEKSPNSLRFRAGHSGLALVLNPTRILAEYTKFRFEFFPEGTHFCFRREIAERIIDRTGRFFWPSSPDFSAPLLLLLECDQEASDYVLIDAMMGFGGRSRHSNGASWERGAENQRVRDYVAEFADDDVLPFNPLKVPFFFNYHATHFHLAKHFYPEAMAKFVLDQRFMFSTFYEEIVGLRYNPLLTDEAQLLLDRYLQECAPAVQAIALDARQAVAVDLGRRRSKARKSYVERLKIFIPFRKRLKQMILAAGFSERAAEPLQKMVSISGLDDFSDGYELFQSFSSIVKHRDYLTLQSVERTVEQDMLIAAYML